MVEVKGDEEIADPSPENVKKREFAAEHFKRLNEWLEKDGISVRYQLNMLSPRDFNKFFQNMRNRELVGFRSELDVAISGAAQETE